MIDIADIAEFDQARADNPDAIIRLVLGDGCYTLFFPVGHPMGRYEVRC